MYTDDNNSNNDKDGEEKKKYTINDKKKKNCSIKTLYLTEGKIRIRQGFKSGNWGNQGNTAVSL